MMSNRRYYNFYSLTASAVMYLQVKNRIRKSMAQEYKQFILLLDPIYDLYSYTRAIYPLYPCMIRAGLLEAQLKDKSIDRLAFVLSSRLTLLPSSDLHYLLPVPSPPATPTAGRRRRRRTTRKARTARAGAARTAQVTPSIIRSVELLCGRYGEDGSGGLLSRCCGGGLVTRGAGGPRSTSGRLAACRAGRR